MYAYCIGQCGIKPSEFWQLSEAETIGIIAGHQILESYDAEKFRNVYEAIIRGNGAKEDVKNLWPLPTDSRSGVTREYLDKRNKDAIEIGKQLGVIKGEC